MKLKYICLGFAILLMTGLMGVYCYETNKLLATYHSPDGNYELIVKSKRGLFSSTMPGDGGMSMPVEVVLKDVSGNILGKSSDADCTILRFSLNIDWDIENNQVWYAKAKTINVITGKTSC